MAYEEIGSNLQKLVLFQISERCCLAQILFNGKECVSCKLEHWCSFTAMVRLARLIEGKIPEVLKETVEKGLFKKPQ